MTPQKILQAKSFSSCQAYKINLRYQNQAEILTSDATGQVLPAVASIPSPSVDYMSTAAETLVLKLQSSRQHRCWWTAGTHELTFYKDFHTQSPQHLPKCLVGKHTDIPNRLAETEENTSAKDPQQATQGTDMQTNAAEWSWALSAASTQSVTDRNNAHLLIQQNSSYRQH